MTKSINYAFRWPVKQTGPSEIQVEIPIGKGTAPLAMDFIEMNHLSDGEIIKAEMAVLESIAIIR
jgi:hypothetical protein